MLASSDVAVKTGKKAMDVEVAAAFSWVSANRLTLDATRSITFDKTVTVAGPGALTLTTNDGGTGGTLSFTGKGSVAFSDTNSSLIIDGVSYTLVGNIATLASDIAANASGNYALAGNYDAAADGTYTAPPIPITFTGTFEGLGSTISHLSIDDTVDADVGLFAEVGTAGMLRDISLLSANVKGQDAGVAPLAGYNHGTIIRASATGSAASPNDVQGGAGGLVATNSGTISQSRATTKVSGFIAGGLVADNRE
jgi:hypothetical protein